MCSLRKFLLWTIGVSLLALATLSEGAGANSQTDESDAQQNVDERRRDEAALNEDPEAQRRSRAQAGLEDPTANVTLKSWEFDFYASARVHYVNTFDIETFERENQVSDGNSRAGVRAEWEFKPEWSLYGRAEFGFDVVESFSSRAQRFGDGGLETRLLFAGIDHDNFTLVYGQNWSAYYQIAGITDRFAIYGGSASGIYNAGTVGQATGTGRAGDVLQARVYVDDEKWLGNFKPFNLNMQVQRSQPIPRVDGESYDFGIGASAWLETQTEFGIGLAYNRSRIENIQKPAIIDAGIDGDAIAAAVSTKAFGDRWFVSAVYSDLRNIETTELGEYFNGYGLEVYAQWEVVEDWWVIGGVNALDAVDDSPSIGEYRVRYTVVGGRYSFDSFKRMVYVEYRINEGRLTDGTFLEDEITVGVRWDFGD
jgi:predicted porin